MDFRVLTVANRKGGSGKTTTAVNLAAAWASEGYNTLLIDLDTQGHAAIGLGIAQHTPSHQCAHHIFAQKQASLIHFVCQSQVKNLSLIPADKNFTGALDCQDWTRLRQQLHSDAFTQRFDRIVIDTAPGQDVVLFNALAASDGVLIPCLMNHLNTVGVQQLARLIYKTSIHVQQPLQLFGLLPIKVSARELQHQRVQHRLSHQFGALRLLSGIRRDVRLAEAFEHGKTIFDYAPKSKGAEDCRQMSHELDHMIQSRMQQRQPNTAKHTYQ